MLSLVAISLLGTPLMMIGMTPCQLLQLRIGPDGEPTQLPGRPDAPALALQLSLFGVIALLSLLRRRLTAAPPPSRPSFVPDQPPLDTLLLGAAALYFVALDLVILLGDPSAVVRSWSALLYRLSHGGTDTPLRSIAGAAGRWGDALTSDDGGVARSSDGAGPSRLDDVVRFGGVVSAVRSPPIGGENLGGGDGVVIDERQLAAAGDAAESSEFLRSTARGGSASSRPSVGDERSRENCGADTTLAAPPPAGDEGEAEANVSSRCRHGDASAERTIGRAEADKAPLAGDSPKALGGRIGRRLSDRCRQNCEEARVAAVNHSQRGLSVV